MTLLVVCPDYASHLLPLATLATAWRDTGERVVVATGPATAGIVAEHGFDHHDLRLGRGSNPGVIRAEEQPPGEDDALRGFFEATRQGMVATLRFQAHARRADLLWDPVASARAVVAAVEAVEPDHVIVDHLAFSARLGLGAAGVRHGDVVLGHPTALPVGDEVYGYPTDWPDAVHAEPTGLRDLHRVCREVRDAFTADWNAALAELDPGAVAVDDAFAVHGDQVLLNYPAQLHPPRRTPLLPDHTFLGSAVRTERVPDDVARWLDAAAGTTGDPLVYVAFGSFLSVRSDVLGRVVAALRDLPVRVALASGSADVTGWGDLPAQWLVRPHLPQVAILRRAAMAITHGGNNSVTEALACGVPTVVLPFSTDQFAGAAAVERAGLGVALDPNTADVGRLRDAVTSVLAGAAPSRARELGAHLATAPGPARAFAALTAPVRPTREFS